MEWFRPGEAAVLLFSAWLFICIGLLPRMIANPMRLSITAMAVGVALAWAVSGLKAHAAPWEISINTLLVILASFGALFHSEVIFRRKNGYWRFLGHAST